VPPAIAALTGLAVIANCDAVPATAIGRSGRTLLKNATAKMTGMSE